MITVRCHCGARVALYNPDTPSVWFTDNAPGRVRSGPGKDVIVMRPGKPAIIARIEPREVTIIFDTDGALTVSYNRGPFQRLAYVASPTGRSSANEWMPTCQRDDDRHHRHSLIDVRHAAERAVNHDRASTTLSARSVIVTDN